jgi:hypothetical protein
VNKKTGAQAPFFISSFARRTQGDDHHCDQYGEDDQFKEHEHDATCA